MHTGMVFWIPGFKWITSCKLDLYYFPFDEQWCEVQFVNWNYGAEEMKLVIGAPNNVPNVSLDYYVPNGEWTLKDTKTGTYTKLEALANVGFRNFTTSMIAFRLHLERKPGFMILNIVAPAILLNLLSLLVYCLPADAGEKISLEITVLLSYTILILMVSEITPRVGDSLPIIGE